MTEWRRQETGRWTLIDAAQRQTAVTAYFSSKPLPLFAFAVVRPWHPGPEKSAKNSTRNSPPASRTRRPSSSPRVPVTLATFAKDFLDKYLPRPRGVCSLVSPPLLSPSFSPREFPTNLYHPATAADCKNMCRSPWQPITVRELYLILHRGALMIWEFLAFSPKYI